MADRILDRHYACAQCGETFRPKRTDRLTYCSRECSFEALANRRLENLRTKAEARLAALPNCEVCGERVNRLGQARHSGQCSAVSARAKAKTNAASKKVLRARPCKECGSSFVPEYGNKRRSYCSADCLKRCSRRAARKKERARLRTCQVETVDPTRVFDRDGWRCQCCRKPSPRERRGTYHPRAPELDHIIPLAKGGEHSYRNTQLLCRACNGAKSDTDGGQQMRLFG